MRCLNSFALFFAFVFLAADASAQSEEVLRKLHNRFDKVSQFDDGLAAVTRNGRSGYVDTTGRLVVGLEYDKAVRFRNGRAVVGKGDKRGMIDRMGRLVTPLEWDHIGNVGDGVAVAYKKREQLRADRHAGPCHAARIRPLRRLPQRLCRGGRRGADRRNRPPGGASAS